MSICTRMVRISAARLSERALGSIFQNGIGLLQLLAGYPASKSVPCYAWPGHLLMEGRSNLMTTTNLKPELPLAKWKDTYYTLHIWTQIVGKVWLALMPLENHWCNATLYLTPGGLTTSTMTYKGRHLRLDFAFISHAYLLRRPKVLPRQSLSDRAQ